MLCLITIWSALECYAILYQKKNNSKINCFKYSKLHLKSALMHVLFWPSQSHGEMSNFSNHIFSIFFNYSFYLVVHHNIEKHEFIVHCKKKKKKKLSQLKNFKATSFSRYFFVFSTCYFKFIQQKKLRISYKNKLRELKNLLKLVALKNVSWLNVFFYSVQYFFLIATLTSFLLFLNY